MAIHQKDQETSDKWNCQKCGGTLYISRSICSVISAYDGEDHHAAVTSDLYHIRGGTRFYCDNCDSDVTKSVTESRKICENMY